MRWDEVPFEHFSSKLSQVMGDSSRVLLRFLETKSSAARHCEILQYIDPYNKQRTVSLFEEDFSDQDYFFQMVALTV